MRATGREEKGKTVGVSVDIDDNVNSYIGTHKMVASPVAQPTLQI